MGAAPAAAGLAREAEAAEAGVGGEAGGGPRASAWHAAGPASSAPVPDSHWLEAQCGRKPGSRLDVRAVTSRHLGLVETAGGGGGALETASWTGET